MDCEEIVEIEINWRTNPRMGLVQCQHPTHGGCAGARACTDCKRWRHFRYYGDDGPATKPFAITDFGMKAFAVRCAKPRAEKHSGDLNCRCILEKPKTCAACGPMSGGHKEIDARVARYADDTIFGISCAACGREIPYGPDVMTAFKQSRKWRAANPGRE